MEKREISPAYSGDPQTWLKIHFRSKNWLPHEKSTPIKVEKRLPANVEKICESIEYEYETGGDLLWWAQSDDGFWFGYPDFVAFLSYEGSKGEAEGKPEDWPEGLPFVAPDEFDMQTDELVSKQIIRFEDGNGWILDIGAI